MSPGTEQNDRIVKMPVYAKYGVAHLWLLDPLQHTLEVFKLEEGRWTVIGLFKESDRVKVAPFTETTLNLGDFWLDDAQ